MNFLNIPSFSNILFLFRSGWRDLINTDFYQLKFSEIEFAAKVGLILFLFVLLKIVWILIGRWLGRDNYSRKDSGHLISEKKYLPARFFLALPTLALFVPLSAIIFAIGNPYFATSKTEIKHIESRTRIDLRDVSGSMSFIFNSINKVKGEIAMRSHLKFLDMRRGKNDRVAFWLFSSDLFPIQEDFVIDDDLLYLQVYDAPWELGGAEYFYRPDDGRARVPQNRYLKVDGQGGTKLSETLRAAIQTFDIDATRQKLPFTKSNGRSVLIITDAAISDFSETKFEFQELGKRGIKPYVIFIDDANGETNSNSLANRHELLEEVGRLGGKFFPVSDERAIEKAYQEIDKLEKIKVEVTKKTLKIPTFQKFIFLAILALTVIIPIGLIFKLFYYP